MLDKNETSQQLTEMAMLRKDAIILANGLGNQFINHFHKIYSEPKSQSIKHWINEMQNWFNNIINIILKPNSKALTRTEINDWFLTVGSDPSKYLTCDDEVNKYDIFCNYLLISKSVQESLKKADIITESLEKSKEGLNEARQQTDLKSTGVYSVLNKKWIKEPTQEEIPDIDEEAFEKFYQEWEDRYFDLIKEVAE